MRISLTVSFFLLFAFHFCFFTNFAFCDISDKDLENIYDDVIDNVESEKFGYEDLNTDELEDFRNNPLDLNSVTRPDLLKLPMLTPRLVIGIIRYRVHHKGFRDVEELKDVPGITDEIYKIIRPFLTVYTEQEKESTRGELRLTQRLELPSSDKKIESPENFHHPEYLMSRLRFFYGDSMEISFTAKRDAWGREINWENFRKYYLVSNYFYAKNFSKFNTVVIGSYKLNFERGFVLGSVAKTIPSVGKDKKGVEPYRASNKNAGFYGIAVQKNTPVYTYALFWSDKYLTVKLNPDGTAKSVPSSVNFSYTGEENFGNLNNLEDYFYGFYFTFPLKTYDIHFIGYREKFNPEIVPVERDESYWDEDEAAAWEDQAVKYIKYKFSAGQNNVFGGGVKTTYGNGRFFFDWALSRHNSYSSNVDKTKESELAKAFQFASLYNFSYTSILFGFSRFDADYYNFHISGDKPVEKMFSEVRAKSKGLNMKWAGEIWREVKPLAEITTKNYYKTYFQVEYPFFKKFKTLFRYQIENQDDKMKFYYTGDYTQI
ncbi:MAG: helix-hairpin-helix domain-containing protein, partial [Elusimicrobia bacterium]|nr:helix-hairpin-helix domain-containing protein [Elusimicrobiota bacterium]